MIELRNEDHRKNYHKIALEISADVHSYSTVHEKYSIFFKIVRAKQGSENEYERENENKSENKNESENENQNQSESENESECEKIENGED